jgi:hypothetical protein
MSADMLTLNGLLFCSEHGNEYCTKCSCDYRLLNNITIQGDNPSTGVKKLVADHVSHIGLDHPARDPYVDYSCENHWAISIR